MYEHTPKLRKKKGDGGIIQNALCMVQLTSFSKKIKFQKMKKEKIEISVYACACAREKQKNWVIFPDVDVIECCNMPFNGIFSPVERILWCFPYKLPQDKRKCLRTA